MSFFDTISRIIQQGKEMAVKATPSSKITYRKPGTFDNSQFTSNPLLRTTPLAYKKPVIQQPVFGIPTQKPVVAPLKPAFAETTPQQTNLTMAQTVRDIIQGGKEAIKLGNEGLVKPAVKGTAEYGLSLGEAPFRLAIPSLRNKVLPSINVPGLSSYTGPLQSTISKTAQNVQDGQSPARAIAGGVADTVLNEPFGIALKPAFAGLGLVMGSMKNVGKMTTKGFIKPAKYTPEMTQAVNDFVDLTNGTKKFTPEKATEIKATAQDFADALKKTGHIDPNIPVKGDQGLATMLIKHRDESKALVGTKNVVEDTVVKSDSLEQEAKKYKSAEEFANNTPNDIVNKLREQGIRGGEQRMKYWEDTVGSKSNDSYKMSHRPTEGVRAMDQIKNPLANKKLEAYRSGKPNSEGGYIKNPLAKTPAPAPKDNQVVSSGNDSIKVYHGTNDKFDAFDTTKQKSGYYPGAYTTTDIKSTKKFGGNVMEAKIDKKKFYAITDGGDGLKAEASKAGFETKAANGNGEVAYLKSKGFEGIKRGKEFIIFGPVNLKKQAPKISTETRLTERVNYLKQFPNKTRGQMTEIRKKTWKLSDLMEKKIARTEALAVKRTEKTVNETVKSNLKLAENASETRARMKQAEEMGLYETQKRNLHPEALDQRRLEVSLQKEALANDPASGLGKYVTGRGEFKGQLQEATGKGSLFGKEGDDIADHFGFKSAEEARQAYDVYKSKKQQYDLNRANLAEDIKAARLENKNIKAFDRAVSPIESIIKRVSTNVAKVTKRVEQKATKRQVQFEKREARRQVIKAKAELVDKMRVASANIENIKADIVAYAKKNLPTNQVGKFVSAVKNAKTQRDAIKAFNRIDTLVTEIEKKTLIRDIQKSVANLPASVEVGYATKIKELVSEINLKGYSKATVQKLEDTQKYLAEQKKLGKDVELPSRLLEKLKILGRTDAKNLTVSQLQGIQDEIDLLKHLGKTKQRIKTNLYEAEKTYIADDLISTAKPLSYREIKTTPGVAQTFGMKTGNKVKQVLNRLKKARLSIRPIDGLAEATGIEQVKNRIDLSYSNYLEKLDNFASQREVMVDRLKLKDTNMERIGIYAAKQQDGGYEKLANLGISEEAANAIKLTDAEQEYYEFGRKMFDEDFDEVKAYMQDVYNKDVGKVDNYVSFQTDFNAMNELEIYDRFGTIADTAVTRTKTVKKDFTESRTGSGGQKIKLNFDSILIRHKDNVSYMLNMGKDIKMYSEILNDPILRSKLGDLGTFAWKDYMSLMARKGGVDSQKQIATIDMLRRNLGVGVMAYKLSTALVQVSSLADAAATIGTKWTSVGVYDIASSREARKFVIDNFSEVREMIGDDIAFVELGNDWLGKVQQAGFAPLRKLDALMRSTSAIAAYRKVANDAGIVVDFTKPNKELVQKATKLVRQSQGSSSFKDSPLALTTGAFTGNVSVDKALFQFQSFMLNRWENIERQIWREGFGSGNYVKGFTAVFWMVVAAGIIEEGSRRVSRGAINLITGEDKEEDPFIETVIGNTVNNVPIVGNIMNSLAYDSNPVPVINAAESTLGGYKRVYSGKETSTKVKGAIDAGFGTANLLFGIPGTVQAGQLIKPLAGDSKSTGNKDLDKAKKADQSLTEKRTGEAEVIVASLKGETPEQNIAYLKELYTNDRVMYDKVIVKVQEKANNWSTEDKAIANLGVKNGAEAAYVKSQAKKLATPEEKVAYLKDLYDRKIISKEVLDQIGGVNNDIIQ